MAGDRTPIGAYRLAQLDVLDAVAAWADENEHRRSDRMTREEQALFDAVTALRAARRTLDAEQAGPGPAPPIR